MKSEKLKNYGQLVNFIDLHLPYNLSGINQVNISDTTTARTTVIPLNLRKLVIDSILRSVTSQGAIGQHEELHSNGIANDLDHVIAEQIEGSFIIRTVRDHEANNKFTDFMKKDVKKSSNEK